MKTISIIGLGWLGLPLGHFLASNDYHIKGSVTSSEKLAQLQGSPFQIRLFNLNPHPTGKNFQTLFDTDVLILNIPPKSQTFGADFYVEQIKYVKILAQQAQVKKLIFISSTSIYSNSLQIAYESDLIDKENTGNIALFQAEQILLNEGPYDLTIVRMGGLMGEKRIPGKYFSGKSNVLGHLPVNYIHQKDAIRMIHWIIQNNLWNEVFNGVAPLHPSRKSVYEKNATQFHFPPPLSYDLSEKETRKIVNSDKIMETGFVFEFPEPLDFDYASN
jgi:nucleoside-diphosphate-sugar epimerase